MEQSILSNNKLAKKEELHQSCLARAKQKETHDGIARGILLFFTILSASFVVFIVLFLLVRGIAPFLGTYEFDGVIYSLDLSRFLLGDTWFLYPHIYGIGFVIVNTIYVSFVALAIASVIGIFSALFIAKIAPKPVKMVLVSITELLAAIPSIVYGVFGVGIITNLSKTIASFFGYQSAGGMGTLSSMLVLAVMIMPTVTLIGITSIEAVKKEVIEASFALGATKMQTYFKVVLASAKSGIIAGMILGLGRALGEATAVSMVAGNAGTGPNFHLFETTRTLTSTILLGFKETRGLDYDIRYSVGLVLIVVIIASNILLHYLRKKVGKIL